MGLDVDNNDSKQYAHLCFLMGFLKLEVSIHRSLCPESRSSNSSPQCNVGCGIVESRERSESHLVPNVSVNNIISAFCSPNESFLIEGVKTGSIFLFVH